MASLPLLRLSVLPASKPSTRFTSSPTLTVCIPHSLRSTTRIVRPKLTPSKPVISMSYQTVPATDRLISAAAYFLPFFNGIQYGRHLFTKYPALALAFEPLFPLMSFYRSIPYASFVAFFALYLGVVRNPNFSRYVRFNSMQAVVLDVLLSIPMLFQRIFNPGRGLGLQFVVMGYNAMFVFIAMCFVYSVVSCITGKTPYLPIVAAAAGKQL
ncbi:protein TIC 20-II, chloroplastic-like [Aristolochia californica]|uniref:protein TIC 20-II, chloroplastic-like n=1 Tax=Aristolochia californica TaxID=171875 RepID=UPI0035E1BB1F